MFVKFVGEGAGDFEVGWVVAGDGATAMVLSVLIIWNVLELGVLTRRRQRHA